MLLIHSFLCYQIDKGRTPFWARFKVVFVATIRQKHRMMCLRNFSGFRLQNKMDSSESFFNIGDAFRGQPLKWSGSCWLTDLYKTFGSKAASKLSELKALTVVWLNFIWSLNSRLCKERFRFRKLHPPLRRTPVTDEPLRKIKAKKKVSVAELEFTRLIWTRSSLGLGDDRVRLHTSMRFKVLSLLVFWFVLQL